MDLSKFAFASLRLGVPAVLVATTVGCGASSGTPSSPFSGDWTCHGTNTLTSKSPQAMPGLTLDSTGSLTISIPDNATFELVTEADAGPQCSLTYTSSSGNATLVAGQSCTFVGPTMTVTATFTNGSATVTGNTLSSSNNYSYTGTTTGPGGRSVNTTGTGVLTSSCTD